MSSPRGSRTLWRFVPELRPLAGLKKNVTAENDAVTNKARDQGEAYERPANSSFGLCRSFLALPSSSGH